MLKRLASAARPSPLDMSIDWEILPSLVDVLARAKLRTRPEPVWSETLPSSFDAAAAQSEDPAFYEPLPGMAIREVTEPEIFRLFFGR